MDRGDELATCCHPFEHGWGAGRSESVLVEIGFEIALGGFAEGFARGEALKVAEDAQAGEVEAHQDAIKLIWTTESSKTLGVVIVSGCAVGVSRSGTVVLPCLTEPKPPSATTATLGRSVSLGLLSAGPMGVTVGAHGTW